MEPLIARAFLTLLLTPEQITDLKAFELTLPSGRYLQGSEIVRRFHIPNEELDQRREENMEDLLAKWEKINWKNSQIENKEHETKCSQKCVCRTRQMEIHEWMDYVLKNWFEPLPFPKRRIADKFELMPLVLMACFLIRP